MVPAAWPSRGRTRRQLRSARGVRLPLDDEFELFELELLSVELDELFSEPEPEPEPVLDVP
jgi:hypothetical protein